MLNSKLNFNKKAIVLFSGGLDSTTLLYYVKSKGYQPYCLIFDYGQRHKKEIEKAKRIAGLTKTPYQIMKFDMPWGGSSLIDVSKSMPARRLNKIGKDGIVPSTYVPGRNTIFMAFALSFAEVQKASRVFIGANAIDFSGYPDCRPEYISAWNKLIGSLKLKNSIKIEAPFVNKTKSEIIKIGANLGVKYGLTWSCYSGLKEPCGKCDSCKLRNEGFRKAGIRDGSGS